MRTSPVVLLGQSGLIRAKLDAGARAAAIASGRRKRRKSRRDSLRLRRVGDNTKGFIVDLE